MRRWNKVRAFAVATGEAVAVAVVVFGPIGRAMSAGPATAPDGHGTAATRPSGNMTSVYKVFVGGSGAAFDSPNITADFADIGGVATVFVNGDPVCSLDDRLVICPINQYLLNGTNVIDVRGSYTGRVYLKLGEIAEPRNKLVGKQVFTAHPEASAPGDRVAFDAVVPATLPERERLSRDPAKVEQYRTEIRAYLDALADDLRAHDGEAVTDKLEYGEIVYDGRLYHEPFTPEKRQQWVTFWGDKDNTVDADNPAPTYTFGDRLVRVAVQPYTSAGQEKYLFRMHRGRDTFVVPPVLLSRVNGKWCCWHS